MSHEGSVPYFPNVQKPIHVEKPLENVVFKSLTMKTIHGRKIFHTWEEIEKIAAANKYVSIPLIMDGYYGMYVLHTMQNEVGLGNNS